MCSVNTVALIFANPQTYDINLYLIPYNLFHSGCSWSTKSFVVDPPPPPTHTGFSLYSLSCPRLVDQAGLELTPACLALSMERALTERSNISSRITDKLLFWEVN